MISLPGSPTAPPPVNSEQWTNTSMKTWRDTHINIAHDVETKYHATSLPCMCVALWPCSTLTHNRGMSGSSWLLSHAWSTLISLCVCKHGWKIQQLSDGGGGSILVFTLTSVLLVCMVNLTYKMACAFIMFSNLYNVLYNQLLCVVLKRVHGRIWWNLVQTPVVIIRDGCCVTKSQWVGHSIPTKPNIDRTAGGLLEDQMTPPILLYGEIRHPLCLPLFLNLYKSGGEPESPQPVWLCALGFSSPTCNLDSNSC